MKRHRRLEELTLQSSFIYFTFILVEEEEEEK